MKSTEMNWEPLTGEDSEWKEITPGYYQNKRYSAVFKKNDTYFREMRSGKTVLYEVAMAIINGKPLPEDRGDLKENDIIKERKEAR